MITHEPTNSLKDDNEKKKIPLRVFEYHLSAINTFIEKDTDFYNLKTLKYFCDGIKRVSNYDEKKLRQLLHNSWSTECAILTASRNKDNDFKKFSLHWCFPQAYYSVFLTTTAYYYLKNITLGHCHKGLITEFAQQIKRNWYPKAISFSCSGSYGDYTYNNVCEYESKNSLSYSKHDHLGAGKQVAQFLKTTRDELIEKKKKEKQSGKNAYKTKSKEKKSKKSLSKDEWKEISKNQWDTTIMDMLYRLRIKSNYEEVNSFIDADYDVSIIIEQLKQIVFKMNFINECYIAKAIGFDKYEEIVKKFPTSIENNHIQSRYNELILKNK